MGNILDEQLNEYEWDLFNSNLEKACKRLNEVTKMCKNIEVDDIDRDSQTLTLYICRILREIGDLEYQCREIKAWNRI